MCLDGSFRHHQRIGNLAVGFALGNQRHYFAFALRKSAKSFSGSPVCRGRFFPRKRSERSVQEVFAQIDIIKCACQGFNPLSRRGKVALGQVFLLEASVLSSQRTIDLPEEWFFLASQGTTPGFL